MSHIEWDILNSLVEVLSALIDFISSQIQSLTLAKNFLFKSPGVICIRFRVVGQSMTSNCAPTETVVRANAFWAPRKALPRSHFHSVI